VNEREKNYFWVRDNRFMIEKTLPAMEKEKGNNFL
jgi:hypothetical protein